MKRTLFFLGAGATKDAGCATSPDMISDLEMNSEFEEYQEALHFLLSSLEYHNKWKTVNDRSQGFQSSNYRSNVEDLALLLRRIVNRDSFLPYPVTGSWADKINQIEISWTRKEKDPITKGLFQSLEAKIIKHLPIWLKVGEENDEYLKPISDFLSSPGNNELKLDFMTLNYDLVFEKHFNNENDETLINTGFTSDGFTGFDGAEWDETRINYYKLHGSLNWFKDEDGLINSIDYKSFIKNPGIDPLIIFGQGGKLLSVDPFITLLYDFKKKLEERDIYVILGYSFFDPYVNNLILEGLKKPSKKKKKMIIINPGMESLLDQQEREDEENRDKLLKDKFIDYLKSVQSSVYLSEQPNFNITEISASDIDVKCMKAKDFIRDYFENGGQKFLTMKEAIERENEDVF